MKRKSVLMLLAVTFMGCSMSFAQNALNNNGDNIVGTYESTQNGDRFKAKIEKLKDGTYRGQVFWMENDKDAKGNKRLDEKNPDKSLRNTPADRIVLFSGLKYDAKKKEWNDTKIYDPQRGMKAKMTAAFDKDGRLKITGSVLLISESVYWKKIQ